MKLRLLGALALGLATICTPAVAAVNPTVDYAYHATGTPTIAEYGEVASSDYWLAKADYSVILDDAAKLQLNRQILGKYDTYNLDTLPEVLTKTQVQDLIRKAAEGLFEDPPYGSIYEGRPLTATKWQELVANASRVSELNPTAWAVTTAKVAVRLLPTSSGIYDDGSEIATHYDALQGTSLDPGEPVVVVAMSADQKFALVFSRSYLGWVEDNALGYTDAATWQVFAYPKDYATVTASKVKFSNPDLVYHMGAALPLAVVEGVELETLPVRQANGSLSLSYSELAPDLAAGVVVRGSLAFTRANIAEQAFKYLGETYGWGGQDNGVDCSSFAQNVYRSLGVQLPRNADSQEHALAGVGQSISLVGLAETERLDALRAAPIGSLLFKPGHMLIWLGFDEHNRPLAIHAASSFYHQGSKIYLRQVVISNLNWLTYSGEKTLNTLTSIGYLD